ncbi:hypothetical protein PCAR4_290040 [Paraburkholderia caribensis]|nr:hypothetical protein PCAR4_290040 [Paraburkholderia caribensis]
MSDLEHLFDVDRGAGVKALSIRRQILEGGPIDGNAP